MNDSRVHRIEGGFEHSEKWLQKYLAKHPELLPAEDLDGIRTELRLVGRELAGIDLLFVDERGLLTIVETKLFDNPEAKREVVAQLQDYAALLSKQLNAVELCRLIARLRGKAIEGLKELEKLTKLLNRYVSIDGSGKESIEHAKAVLAHYVVQGTIADSSKLLPSEKHFLEKLDLMLKEGSFRLVIVTDRAVPELLDLLNYVNSTMRRGHQLVAFELSVEDIKGSKCFVPHLIGAPGLLSAEYYREEKADIRRKWEKEEFLNELPQDLRNDVSQLINLLESRRDRLWYDYGTGKETGNLLLCVNLPNGKRPKRPALLGIKTTGMVSLHYGFLNTLTQSQKENLLSIIKSKPFLRNTYKNIEASLKGKKHRFTEPILELKDCGVEGGRAKNLVQLLEDFSQVVNSVS